MEQLKNLLLTNIRLLTTDEKLTHDIVDFSYSISIQETKGKKEEVVFYFSITADTENDDIASELEDFDKLLRRTTPKAVACL